MSATGVFTGWHRAAVQHTLPAGRQRTQLYLYVLGPNPAFDGGFMEITPPTLEQATAFIDAMRGTSAVHARYDRTANRIVITLNSGIEIGLPPRLAEGLAGASPDALTVIDIIKDGRSLHWPRLSVDLFVPGLLLGKFTPDASGCTGLNAAEAVVRAQTYTHVGNG